MATGVGEFSITEEHMNTYTEPPVLDLYSGVPQHEVFPRLGEIFPTSTLHPSTQSHEFARGAPVTLPECYAFEGEHRHSEVFLKDTDTAALMVLKDGLVRFERYALTGGPDVCWIS